MNNFVYYAVIDGTGLYGAVLHYAMTIALVSSALLFFIYFWFKGRLDLDENPKWQMMQCSEEENEE